MNPIEIEEQLSKLAGEPFDAAEFPFQFLECFGNKPTNIKSLRKGKTNKTDIDDGVLQRLNIHMLMVDAGGVDGAMDALRASKATTKNKAKFIFATDGETVASENLNTGDHLACDFDKLGENFTFFLPLAGIYFTAEIKNQDVDIKATARLNKLYMELLKENPDWTTPERRHDLNQFMARLIFCFFAEDTDIFLGNDLFTTTIKQMSDSRSGNVTEVVAALFDAMDTPIEKRDPVVIRPWANAFPYVNGGLFGGNKDVPKFSRIARSYMIAAGELNWSKINPDIFGSMIQAVADDDERGSLGMHYTSVPNILKVLNPLFIDDLREKLEDASNNKRKLLNLRKRIANIRIFDPACGSGNFLVIAYKELRKIEAEILDRRGDENRNTVISLENFYGIEIKDFAAQIAQIALLIAEFQCDVLYINQVQACKNMLPLDKANNIVIGNALRLDWLEVCPPTAPVDVVKDADDDLFDTPLEQTEINLDEDNLGGETYICGNPPYKGARKQDKIEKHDLELAFKGHKDFKDADYVTGWFLKSSNYCNQTGAIFTLVSTSSVCQGEQVQFVWPRIWKNDQEIYFAYTPFQWKNNAANNAGVYVVILGIRNRTSAPKILFDELQKRFVSNISPYLTDGEDIVVQTAKRPVSPELSKMIMGNMARDDGNLILSPEERNAIIRKHPVADKFITPLIGTKELVGGTLRYALHLTVGEEAEWSRIPPIKTRVDAVENFRKASKAKTTNGYASVPYRFAQYCHEDKRALILPSVTPEERTHVTPLLLARGTMVTNLAYVLYDFDLELFAVLASRLHIVWVRSVSGRHGSGVRYTPTISYHTFPVPKISAQDKATLRECAADIMLARAAHFPKTIAELYKPEDMPDDLRAAHERNDETLERIYIGRRFKTDTERLETLFDLYTKMTKRKAA
ncbi:class I SAM-dependent DNA methyltransferase [Litorimonas sp.]|uniref:class I SAM-dependent DNA methyltransferase n=1 Tax=Litorimonas sp. TaxID=1892381 RepID=UPI003A891065